MVIRVHFISLKESVDFSNNDDDTMEEMESDTMEEMESDTPAQSSGNFSIMCRKCEKEKIDTAVLPCKHAYLCLNCAEHLKEQKGLCPHCSEPVKDIFHFSLPDN